LNCGKNWATPKTSDSRAQTFENHNKRMMERIKNKKGIFNPPLGTQVDEYE
jgi:hypothetical protein